MSAAYIAAKAYDDILVPALFQEWAPRVVATAGLLPGERVLDVACGTGVLARAAADRVGVHGFVAGLDPNAWMLRWRTTGIRRLNGGKEKRSQYRVRMECSTRWYVNSA
jgi:ubiquinone/menaquinone biosynthesis C-methylase UbiE